MVLTEYFSFYFRTVHKLYIDFMVISYTRHTTGAHDIVKSDDGHLFTKRIQL